MRPQLRKLGPRPLGSLLVCPPVGGPYLPEVPVVPGGAMSRNDLPEVGVKSFKTQLSDPIRRSQDGPPVGEPAGLCTEGPAGVFSRPWTYGAVTLDCNKWGAEIPTA